MRATRWQSQFAVKILGFLDVSCLMRGANALFASILMINACVRMILVAGVRAGGLVGAQCVGKWEIECFRVWGEIPK